METDRQESLQLIPLPPVADYRDQSSHFLEPDNAFFYLEWLTSGKTGGS